MGTEYLLRLANYYCQSRCSVRRLTKSLFARLTMVTERGLNPRVKHLDGILSFRLMTSQPKSLSCLYLVGDSFKDDAMLSLHLLYYYFFHEGLDTRILIIFAELEKSWLLKESNDSRRTSFMIFATEF